MTPRNGESGVDGTTYDAIPSPLGHTKFPLDAPRNAVCRSLVSPLLSRKFDRIALRTAARDDQVSRRLSNSIPCAASNRALRLSAQFRRWGIVFAGDVRPREPQVMEYVSLPSTSEPPPWDRLMRAFLTLLQTDDPRTAGDAVAELFFDDPWFRDLISRRAKHAVDTQSVPSNWRKDLEQEISLLFVQKADKKPDLHVNLDVVEIHFGGWVWTIIDHLCAEAVKRLHRVYRADGDVLDDLACSPQQDIAARIDMRLLIAGLPPLTRTILTLFDEGHTLTEIAEFLDEPYWRVSKIYRKAVARLRDQLLD